MRLALVMIIAGLPLCLAPLLSACGDGGGGGAEDTEAPADVVGDVGPGDPGPGDPTGAGDETGGGDVGDATDGGAPDVDDGDEPDVDEGDPAPGEEGASCASHEDCYSGWCMPSGEGLVCSKGCLSSCPDGWLCRSITGPTGAPAFVCIDPLALLCLPCVDHKDCNQAVAGATSLCVSFGDEGSFCAVACDEQTPCPAGFGCASVPAPGGGTAPQCVPAEGALCECSPLGIELGPQTACAVSNDHGSCPGGRGCEASGLGPCDGFEPAAETCNGADDDCDGQTDEDTGGGVCEVATPDGTCPGISACQAGALVCTGASPKQETCNGLDDDCDGLTDEDEPDFDGDGQADCVDDDDDDDGTPDGADCAPFDDDVHAAATEKCDDDKDNDCDGLTDEAGALGCSTFWLDADGDGYGSDQDPTLCLCEASEELLYTGTIPGDCDDLNPAVLLGGDDPCDGLDNDCDGLTDESATDVDGDGLASCLDDDDDGDGTPDAQDCAPQVAAVHPGAIETCNGGVDDDCDGLTDEQDAVGCSWFLEDADGDGKGATDVPARCQCGPDEDTQFTAKFGGDCDDLDGGVHDGAVEVCNGKDDDCDGQTDTGSLDSDGDGQADCVDTDDDDDGVPDDEDCDALDPKIHGGSPEVCGGGDEDCDGAVDEQDAGGCKPYWRDLDGDGAGSDAHASRCLCHPDAGTWYTVQVAGDCDDADPSQGPGQPEACNQADDDCDGVVDEGVKSPCGDCSSFCVVRLGPDGDEAFAPSAATALKTTLNGDGELTMTETPGSGFYRHVVQGWPGGATTLWQMVMVQGDMSLGSTWVTVRFRTAQNQGTLTTAPWQGPYGPFPPELFPLDIDQTAKWFEVEVTLHSMEPGASPTVHEVSVVASGL